MQCVVSGSTGFIGRRLTQALRAAQHDVTPWKEDPGSGAVVHLAGEPVAQRWTPRVKRQIRDSRVLGTRRLVDAMAKAARGPSVLVCASAVGFYGDRGDETVDESSPPGSGFLPDVCREWEAEADRALDLGIRVVKIRIGIVMGREGGMLKQVVPAFRAFAGARLGSGKQWLSWIHIDDLVAMFQRAVEDENVAGVWNGTSPNPVTNAQFTGALAEAVRRPALLAMPGFALKLLFGELADSMLTGARVIPHAAQTAGFEWKHANLANALIREVS